jgi:hypothetical protein
MAIHTPQGVAQPPFDFLDGLAFGGSSVGLFEKAGHSGIFRRRHVRHGRKRVERLPTGRDDGERRHSDCPPAIVHNLDGDCLNNRRILLFCIKVNNAILTRM